MAPSAAPAWQLAEAVVGAVRIGIPAAAVLQALAAPPAAVVLPRRQGALCGVAEHDGKLVPVVDLARWVEVGAGAPDDAARARVLVLRDGARTIGLRVDAVGGLVEVAHGQLARLHHDDGHEEVFHSVARAPGGGAILSVLDVARLADLAAAWHRADGAAAAEAAAACADADDGGADGGPDDATRAYALLQAGAVRLAVAADDLAEILPMPPLERFGNGAAGGYCLWRGRHLAVLAADAVAADAHAANTDADGAGAAGGDAPLLAVIAHAGLALGLPVRAALELRGIDAGAAARAVPCAGGLAATLFDEDGRALRLLDTARLFARYPEAALSRDDDAAARSPGAAQAANAVAYIVFEADGHGAVPIDTVEEVLALPPAIAAAASLPAAMPWRGGSIALADLRPGTATAPGADGHVLVMRGAHGPTACVVTRLHVMVPAGAGRLYRMGAGSRAVEFIATGDAAQQASYRIVDPAAAAAAVAAEAAAAAATAAAAARRAA